MTRDEFLAMVRAELQDSGANYVWGEGQLVEFLAEGLQRLSRDVPPLVELNVALVPGQRDYELSEIWGINQVVLGGVTIPRYWAGLGEGRQAWAWLRLGASSVLRLRYPPGPATSGTFGVEARGFYQFPASNDAELAIAEADKSLLKWLICGRAISWLHQIRAKRGEAGVDLAPGYYENLYRLTVRSRRSLQAFVLVG